MGPQILTLIAERRGLQERIKFTADYETLKFRAAAGLISSPQPETLDERAKRTAANLGEAFTGPFEVSSPASQIVLNRSDVQELLSLLVQYVDVSVDVKDARDFAAIVRRVNLTVSSPARPQESNVAQCHNCMRVTVEPKTYCGYCGSGFAAPSPARPQLFAEVDGWAATYVLDEAAKRLGEIGNSDVAGCLHVLADRFNTYALAGGAASSATPTLEQLIVRWRREEGPRPTIQADPVVWGNRKALNQCAEELEAVLADPARLHATPAKSETKI